MLPNQMFNAVLSSLRTFDPLSDTLDILIISFVFYQLLQFARKSRAGQLVRGLILALLCFALAYLFELRTVRWLLNNFLQVGFIAAVVLFQPELRRALEQVGRTDKWASNRMGEPAVRQPPHRSFAARCVAERCGCHLRCG